MKYGDEDAVPSGLYELLDEIQIIKQPLPTYLVDGLIPEDSINLLTGQKGVYKSFMGLDMALTMTHGKGSFHGRATQDGGAIYFAGEGAGGLGKRIAAWRLHHKIDHADTYGVKSPFWLVRTPINLLNEADIDQIIRSIKDTEQRYGCMIKTTWVDTISRAIQGAKEDEQTWGAIITAGERIKNEVGHRMAFIGIAHQGKDASRGTRGSSVAECNADAVLTMYSDKENAPDELRLHVSKLKDDEDGNTYNFVTCQYQWTGEQGKTDSLVLIEDWEETDMQRNLRLDHRRERQNGRDRRAPDLLERIANLPPNIYLLSEAITLIGKKPGRINEKVIALVPIHPIRVEVSNGLAMNGTGYRLVSRRVDALRGQLIQVADVN